ncbi:MAG: glycoside hydrolase family 13 protein [Verrucomicrobiota bacterium]
MRHEPHLRRFVNQLDNGQVLLKLQSECDEIRAAHIVIRGNGEQPLDHIGHAHGREYYSVTVPGAHRFEYAFRLFACGFERWVTPTGNHLHVAEPPAWFVYEPSAHRPFETPAWVRDAVFYQIFPDRFCNGDPANDPARVKPWGTKPALRNFMGGDLAGILSKLDYLADLGINALYLTPIFKSASNHKYDTIDYYQVDEHFGDLALVKKLVAECHRRGLRIIFDAVFNHCSNRHPYFVDVRKKGKKSTYWDWFHIHRWPIPARFANNQESLKYYNCWWGFHTLPQLNYHNPAVEAYFLDVAQYWLNETGMDGWRLDVPNEVIQSFWPKFRHVVKTANPAAYIVGEIWDDATSWLQGDQFDAVMNYRFQKALIHCFADKTLSIRQLDSTLRQVLVDYPEQATAVMLNLLGSHDTARPMTAILESGSGLSAATALEALKLITTVQFTFEGAPCIYYGDEIGLEGGKDPDCRRCYPWDKPRLQNRELFAHYQRLLAIRHANPALRRGKFRTLIADDDRELYVYERRLDDNRCFIAINRSPTDQVIQFGEDLRGRELLHDVAFTGSTAMLPARQSAIWQVA